MKTLLPLLIGALLGLPDLAQARSLDAIRDSGVLGLCAHPNSLPFASKAGDPPGFQIELGNALARELGVSLRLDWIITQYQMRSAGCDIVLDVIADREAQGETRLRISKPYYRTGVALAVPQDSRLTSFKSLDEHTKVGVLVGSMAAMTLGQRHVPTSTFGFEVDSLEARRQSRDRCRGGHADDRQLFQSDASGQGGADPRSRRQRAQSELECRRRHGQARRQSAQRGR